MTDQKKKLIKEFENPTNNYRGKPFWSWNGELNKDELIRQTHIMKDMGLGGYFMHSRSGLITEYLSDEWFEYINAVADESEKTGMEAWLYDEDRWPSGSAGGMVTRDRKYSMKSLYLYEYDIDKDFTPEGETVAIFVGKVDGINLWEYTQADNNKKSIQNAAEMLDATKGELKILHFCIVPDKSDSNYNGETYIDTMNIQATNRFIALTHEKYKEKCGQRIGTSIKGIFTDEPHRGHCLDKVNFEDGVMSCPMCYTDKMFEEFKLRYNYDPKPILPELFYRYKGKTVSPIKLDYIDLANNLFIENFALPIKNWCDKNNMTFTGHVLHEDSLMCQTSPNGSVMRFYEHMHAPGIDCLSEYNRCYWIVKQLSSVARQLDKKWMLSELYGATGWDLNFKSHKAIGDWQTLFGINLRCHHLSWYTMEGESKRDYPASILHQSPWWQEYNKVESYFARFGAVISSGKPMCDLLVINPIESLWCQAYIGWADWIYNKSPDIAPYEQRYAQLFHILAENQIDFDYGEEQMMSQHAKVEIIDSVPYLCVGKMKYRSVIVTNMLTIRKSTIKLLEEFMSFGGKVIFAGDTPKFINAIESDKPSNMANSINAIKVCFDEQSIVSAINDCIGENIKVLSDNLTAKEVFAQIRELENSYLICAINTDTKKVLDNLTLKFRYDGKDNINIWDMESGERYSITQKCKVSDGYLYIPFSLEASGSICFEITKDNENLPSKCDYYHISSHKIADGEFEYSLDEGNICVLDMAEWKINDGEWNNADEVLKVDSKIRDHFEIEHRGGCMLQPWFAKQFDSHMYGKICLKYRFFIETMPKSRIILACERPTLNTYTVNGHKLEYNEKDGFWVDECFKKIYIDPTYLESGENEICVSLDFARTSNIEALYLVGDFGVEFKENLPYLTSMPKKIFFGRLDKQKLPFYTGKVTYKLTKEQYTSVLDGDCDRVLMRPTKFTGACIIVKSKEKSDILAFEPYFADITDAYASGDDIYITVVGTRRNTFGPLHLIPAIQGAYSPESFVTKGDNWTYDYSLIDSGIEGIELILQKK